MSEYSFKNLSDVETVAEPAEDTTVMGFQNGTPIQMPMSAIKASPSGGSESNVFVINPDDPEYSETDPTYGDKIKESLLAGKAVYFYGVLATGSNYPHNEQRGYFCLSSFTPASYLGSAKGAELWLKFFKDDATKTTSDNALIKTFPITV